MAAANVELLPDYIELLCADETRDAIAALPEPLQELFSDLMDRRSTLEWIHEEIAYRLGAEVARLQAGGAR
jgi:hypothetical protein